MKPFHAIAIPHKDVIAGKLTMDVFAADLWQVRQNRGSDEYKDAQLFFKKTFVTQGLQNLLSIVQKRLEGKGGDPVIQIQTPFGGGKTHSLIALYHKLAEWKAKPVVIVGTAPGGQKTLWGWMEEQLEGEVKALSGMTSPGKIAIRKLLEQHQPLLILMDEILEYAVKAAGVKVEDSTLAAQCVAFMQELSETVAELDRACLVVTLPSSIVEHYDQSAERLYHSLQKVAGRVEKIYTPIDDKEVTSIIRSRLFSSVDETAARDVIDEFVSYVERENILPPGTKPTEYRDRFLMSYPFLPEVIDVLYQRWGSFHTFQRTRGVLRLLALVVHALRKDQRPYIRLSDFDLSNQEIRQELTKHIGAEYNSVISSDITDPTSGAQRVNGSLGTAYEGLSLGSSTATAVFLYSFSGGQERGATLSEVKRAATTTGNPSSVVSEAIEQLKAKLIYLQPSGERLFFSNLPNLNHWLLVAEENVKEPEILKEEKDLLKQAVSGQKLKVLIWPDPGEIQDLEILQLVILSSSDKDAVLRIIENRGQSRRVYRNALLFLSSLESERVAFHAAIRKSLAMEAISTGKEITLSEEQKKDVARDLKKLRTTLGESLRRAYRLALLPAKDGIQSIDLGIPTYGEQKSLDSELYEKLRIEGQVLENLAPLVIREKYLAGKEWVNTGALFQSSLRTPGEPRLIGKQVLANAIREGVRTGIFGLGELEAGKPRCRSYKVDPSVALSGDEIILSEKLCIEQVTEPSQKGQTAPTIPASAQAASEKHEEQLAPEGMASIHLSLKVPKGKVATLMGVMNYLQSKFETLEVTLQASDGSLTDQELQDKVMEAFDQAGIHVIVDKQE